jgi:hypothetical protein
VQVLPGSANLFGGYGVILKPIPAVTVQAMKFPGAPPGMKMACGENPKYTYAELGRAPQSRMGVVVGYRGRSPRAGTATSGADGQAGQNKSKGGGPRPTLGSKPSPRPWTAGASTYCYRSTILPWC